MCPPTGTCGNLNAITDFQARSSLTLADGSALTMSESGTACAPRSSSLTPGGLRSYGTPRSWSASWTVQTATGRFAGLAGADAENGRNAGAEFRLSYSGRLDG